MRAAYDGTAASSGDNSRHAPKRAVYGTPDSTVSCQHAKAAAHDDPGVFSIRLFPFIAEWRPTTSAAGVSRGDDSHLPVEVGEVGVLQRLVDGDAVLRVKNQLGTRQGGGGGDFDVHIGILCAAELLKLSNFPNEMFCL